MYVPAHFRVDDYEKLAAFIDENSFAILVTQGEQGPFATHLPLLLDREAKPLGRLLGHVARANPQWQRFGEGQEALTIFHGAHAYISPLAYVTGPAVPTWNYVAVHAYGVPKLITDPPALDRLLARMIAKYETGRAREWKDHLPTDFKAKMMRAIVGFEIPIARLEGKFKLGQNRPDSDLESVYATLSQSDCPEERRLAEIMKQERVVGTSGARETGTD